MTNPDVVKFTLLACIDEIATDPGHYAVNPGRDFTRKRKIDFHRLIHMLLTMEADCLKEELYRFFGRSPDTPSKSAFYKQRQKLRDETLPDLLYAFNDKLQKKLFRNKYQLIACDGSAIDIFRNPKDSDTFFEANGKSSQGYNQVHINSFFSIMDRRFTNLIIQPARKKNEYRAFCEMVDAAGNDGPPTIYLCDMGYASYNNFAHVIENGQFFVIRCNDKRVKGILGQSPDLLGEIDFRVERILSRSQSRKKRSRPELSSRYRHVCKTVSMDYLQDQYDEYDIPLRVVRLEIKPGCFENLITNLPKNEFRFEEFKDLYHLRWNEENSFRDLKHPLCLKAFHSKKYRYIVQEIWARAILHNFSSEIISGVEIKKRNTKYEYQVNYSEAFKICRDFLRIHDEMTQMKVGSLIAQNTEAIRPGRIFARQHRFQLPFRFCYRN